MYTACVQYSIKLKVSEIKLKTIIYLSLVYPIKKIKNILILQLILKYIILV